MLFGLASILWLSFNLCYAASYVYDSSGRLVAVTRDGAASTQYVYDSLGNLQEIKTVPANQLAVFGFAPNHGGPGEVVTISGQGFSPTPTNDLVAFNGAAASVTAATSSTLSVVVPSAATTGPISVKVGSQTATSADAFVVDSTGLPPVITSFSPAIVSAGANVTVTGQHLDPVPGQTSVTLNSLTVSPSSMADTSIVFPVPATVGSGHIGVETPYGLAISSQDLVVAPSDITAADIETVKRIGVGEVQSLTISTGEKYGALLFDASNGDWLSFQVNSLATSDGYIWYSVYDPQNRLVSSGQITPTERTAHLPELHSTGTYSIYFETGSSAATLTVGLETSPVVAVGAPATSLATSVASESKRFLFPVTQGQTLALRLVSLATAPAGDDVTVTVMTPAGGTVKAISTDTPTTINLPNLLQGGTYQVVFEPSGGDTEHLSFQVVEGVSGTLVVNDPSATYTLTTPGLKAYFSFKAAAGDNLGLALSGISTDASDGYISFAVYDASGNEVASESCYESAPASSCSTPLWNLAGGTYSVVVEPDDALSTMHFTATLSRDLAGTLTAGSPIDLNLSRPGQNARLSFAGSTGETVVLGISGVSTTPAGNEVTLVVRGPDGSELFNGDVADGDSTSVNLPNLSSAGTYSVDVVQEYGLPSKASITLAKGVTGTLTAGGSPSSFATNMVGEDAYLSFTAAAGDDLELVLSGLATDPADSYVDFNVFDADGNYITDVSCSTSSTEGVCNVPLWDLAAGTYTVIASPENSGTMSFNATLLRNQTSTLAMGATASVDLAEPGQNARLAFQGTEGETVAIRVSGVATTPEGNYVEFNVYAPDGTNVADTDTSDGATLNLPDLPASGTYWVYVVPESGFPATANVSLITGVTGSLVEGGASPTFATSVPDQNVYLSFNAIEGDDLELELTHVATSPSGGSIYFDVYDGDGDYVASQTCSESGQGDACTLSLPDLSAGAYSVVVQPDDEGSMMQFTATLSADSSAQAASRLLDVSRLARTAQQGACALKRSYCWPSLHRGGGVVSAGMAIAAAHGARWFHRSTALRFP
jgi:YD repeat-containing protein